MGWNENVGKRIKAHPASGELLHLWFTNSQDSQGWKREIEKFSWGSGTQP